MYQSANFSNTYTGKAREHNSFYKLPGFVCFNYFVWAYHYGIEASVVAVAGIVVVDIAIVVDIAKVGRIARIRTTQPPIVASTHA